jgi:hypothetical protein
MPSDSGGHRHILEFTHRTVGRAMELRLILRFLRDKLSERATYILAAVVGTLINLYGQLLVPWLRGVDDPFAMFAYEVETRPWLTLLSVFLGYAFPFCVGTYSSVTTRYKNRRLESIADFPERKPDPVFRATESGHVVEAGAATREMFLQYGVENAQGILGDNIWRQILNEERSEGAHRFFFEQEGVEYIVSHARTSAGEINVYLSRFRS